MTEAILLIAISGLLIAVLYLIGYASRRAGKMRGEAAGLAGLTDGSSAASHSHVSHSHVDCSTHSVDCGGHGGH